MKHMIILFLACFIVGCTIQHDKNYRFTKEQIASLEMDSTTIINVRSDSLIKIDLNPFLKKHFFDFGSLVDEVKLLSLETTNESLLDNILKILVTDSNIYIYDRFKGGGIVIFNDKGKFVKRIPHGQGPGELFRLYDIDFDKERGELIAYQHPFLLFFSPSGEFIRQVRLPFGFYNFAVIPNGYVFKTLDRKGNEHLGLLKNFTLLVTDKNFKLKSAGLPCSPSDVNLGGYDYLYNNTTLHITQKYTDTIYQYIGAADLLKAQYSLNYSKKKLPERYLQGTRDEFRSAIRQNDFYFYLGEFVDTDSHNAFFLENWHIGLQTVIYRDKISGNTRGGTNADLNLNEIPPIGFPKATSGEYFISYHFPNNNDTLLSNSSIISNEDKLKILDLTEDDNPILVFFKLKSF